MPEVLQAIDSCDFLAIDGEFSGLRKAPDLDVYDTPASHYSKLLDGSMEFLLIQVGLCTFKLDRSKNKFVKKTIMCTNVLDFRIEIIIIIFSSRYVYKAFNFYVFPRAIDKKNQDINFLFQASAINFLSDAGFDFNKLYKEGNREYVNLPNFGIISDILDLKICFRNSVFKCRG